MGTQDHGYGMGKLSGQHWRERTVLTRRLPETSLHYSTDEGRTWHGPVLIDHTIGAYPSLVELRDGRFLCVYYEEGAGSAIRAVTLRVERADSRR